MNLITSAHPLGCIQCGLSKARTNILCPVLPKTTEVLIVSEYPSKIEDQTGIHDSLRLGISWPFRNILLNSGFDEQDYRVGYSFVNRCRPNEVRENVRKAGVFVRPVRANEVKTCMSLLRDEVARLPNLKVVVALGANTGKAIMEQSTLKISLLQGELLTHSLFKNVLVTSSPSRLNYCKTVAEAVKLKSEIIDTLHKAFLICTGAGQNLTRTPRQMYIVRNRRQLDWVFFELCNPVHKVIAFDFETTSLDYLEAEILCISVSWKAGTGVTIPFVGYRKERIWEDGDLEYIWNNVRQFLENPSIRKIAHNGKYDIQVARTNGIIVQNFYCDTMIMHYLLDENTSHALESLSYTFTDYGGYDASLYDERKRVAIAEHIKLTDVTYDLLPPMMLWKYAAGDACMTYELYHIFKPRIVAERLVKLLFEHFMPLIRAFADIEYDGVSVDFEYLIGVIREYEKKIEKANAAILQDPQVKFYENKKREDLHKKRAQKWASSKILMGRYTLKEYIHAKDVTVVFNPGSSKQLKELFIDQLQMKVIKTTDKNNPQIDAEVLNKYAKKVSVAKLMAEANKLSTLYTTFMIGIRDNIRVDGKLHQSINVHVAKTGRLCVSGNTQLETDQGWFTVADLPLKKPGQYSIISHTGNWRKILRKFYKGQEQLYTVILDTGNYITCTKGHEFLTVNSWKSLKDINCGDQVYTYSYQIKPSKEVCFTTMAASIVEIVLAGIQGVWDIEVEEDHSYCAQGFINHNSSSGPNLQNIPNKANNPNDFAVIRNIIVADPGCVLLEADYGQAEFRMWGQLSGDPILLEDLRLGVDIHRKVASLGFGITEDTVSSIQRTAAKSIVFGTMYGRSARSVATQLSITIQEAIKLQEVLLKRYPTAVNWVEQAKRFVIDTGYVVGFFGQRRHLKDSLNHPDNAVRAAASRQAVNSPIQGSASQMNCFAVLNIIKLFKQNAIEGRVLMLIHDSIIVNVKQEQEEIARRLVTEAMLKPHPAVTVPLKIEMKMGKRWGEVEEVGVEYA